MAIQLLHTQVYHKRFLPKQHSLCHNIFYYMVALTDLPKLNDYALSSYNHFNVWSLASSDYGFDGDGLNPERFEKIKSDYHIPNGIIYLITVPKFLGYGFNPVSFFLFYDTQNHLRAVLSEVHNTFKERHSYISRHDDGGIIRPTDIMRATKIFHVSPFFPVSGHYLFQFHNNDTGLNIKIDYYNEQNQKTLATGIKATKQTLTKTKPIILALRYPFISIKILLLIHYHAVILWLKKIAFFKKPKPPSRHISS
jgi:DUF1365 family protein